MNGAGKSTAIRILLGLLKKDGGEVKLLGRDPFRDCVKLHRQLAYVPSEINPWPNLSGGKMIDLLSRMRGDVDYSRRSQLMDRFQFDPSKKCRNYSKGNRQKIALIAAAMSTALSVCFIAALTAVSAQLAPNARLARGLSFGAIAVFLMLCLLANALHSNRLLLLTPFGWCACARPYAGENWSLFLFAIPVTALLIIAAYALLKHRDMGVGYLREMKGRTAAKNSFRSPFALSWRLQRGTLLVSRISYIAGHLCFAYLGSFAAIALFGLFTGNFLTSISRIPVVWIAASVTTLFFGIAPRMAASAGWGLFGILLALEFMWELRIIGNGVFRLSPFAWVYPGNVPSVSTLVIMILLSAILTEIGLAGFTKRNITAE